MEAANHTAIIKVQLCKDRVLPSLDDMAREITLSSCGAIGAFSGIKLAKMEQYSTHSPFYLSQKYYEIERFFLCGLSNRCTITRFSPLHIYQIQYQCCILLRTPSWIQLWAYYQRSKNKIYRSQGYPISGITRDNFNGRKVKTLFYEGYESMAVKELQKLAEKAVKDYELYGISICHRLGEVKISEASVNIVTLSPHRKEALHAAAWAIDELKMKVPIWKKEYYEDGTVGEQQCCSGQDGHGAHSHKADELEAKWKDNPEFKHLREQAKDY